ncbi:hypothetical protein DH86_00000030 [Scytalidium sp. 3C]|nr:hypothetical protein DH86_00000030 [Scytalidium sp. 3C]
MVIMENGTVTQGEGGKDPSGFLGEIIGHQVRVKLNSGVVYRGELQSVDGYMNIALEKTEEYVNGVKKRSYGDAFINSMITYKWTHTRGVTLCWSFGVWASARAIVRAHRFISDRDYSGEMHSSL